MKKVEIMIILQKYTAWFGQNLNFQHFSTIATKIHKSILHF